MNPTKIPDHIKGLLEEHQRTGGVLEMLHDALLEEGLVVCAAHIGEVIYSKNKGSTSVHSPKKCGVVCGLLTGIINGEDVSHLKNTPWGREIYDYLQSRVLK